MVGNDFVNTSAALIVIAMVGRMFVWDTEKRRDTVMKKIATSILVVLLFAGACSAMVDKSEKN